MHYALTETSFGALLEAAPDAIVIVDDAGRIVIANGQVEQLFGYARTTLIGQPVELLLPTALHGRHAQHRAAYIDAPRTRPMGVGLHLVARRRDGSDFPVEISLSPLHTPDGLLVTAVIRDVTDRQRAAELLEQQVQQRTAHLNALLQFSQELLSVRGLDAVLQRALGQSMALVPEAQRGAIYLADPTNQQLTLRASTGFSAPPALQRITPHGLVGRAFATNQPVFTHSVAELEALLALVPMPQRQHLLDSYLLGQLPSGALALPLIAHEQPIGALLLLRTSGDGPFAAEAHTTLTGLTQLVAAAIWEDQRAHEAATLTRRLTQLEVQQQAMTERLSSAEAAMLQAARLAAVGQLAASVAHEINNPLYAARNALYLLEGDLPPELRDTQFLAIARTELTRIAGIIERMRDFYRPPRGEMAPHNIHHILEETLALADLNLRHTPIRMIFAPDASLPAVVCSSDQLRQVFLNLIMNAIEAMPNGGTLTVRTIAGSTVAVVEIEDTGVGIPDAIRARLFEPFFTNKANGTGLGLSISAHIVTQHGGQIEVESHAGEGSTFRVVLPYQPNA
ncbi:MAG: PAS domain S-box protein [Chloroflexales bacterium]|nr:PAS domain S-box protein [Chloroflexales bacterium]